VSVCLSVCHLSPAKTAEAIEMLFASTTRVGPWKRLLHIADRFGANTALCSFNTIQPATCNCPYTTVAFLLRPLRVTDLTRVTSVTRALRPSTAVSLRRRRSTAIQRVRTRGRFQISGNDRYPYSVLTYAFRVNNMRERRLHHYCCYYSLFTFLLLFTFTT